MITLLLWAGLSAGLAGGLCGILGVLQQRLRITTAVFAVAHGALAGAAASLLLRTDPLITALPAAALVAFLMGPLTDLLNLPADLVALTLFSTSNAIAFLCIALSPGIPIFGAEVTAVLWGSVLAATPGYTVLLAALLATTVLALSTTWPHLLPILFDRHLAEAEGLNTRRYVYGIIAGSGVVIVLSLRLVGAFLVFGLLYIPAALAIRTTQRLNHTLLMSAATGGVSGVIGLLLSLVTDLPVGACIVLTATLLLITGTITHGIASRTRVVYS